MERTLNETIAKAEGGTAGQSTRIARIALLTAVMFLGTIVAMTAFAKPAIADETAADGGAIVHVSLQWYRADSGAVEDCETYDVAATISESAISAIVAQEPLRLDAGCSWRVMKNFAGGIPCGEEDITAEASLDEKSGALKLPASRADEDITLVLVMPWDHGSHTGHGSFRGAALKLSGRPALRIATANALMTASADGLVAGTTYPLSIRSGANGLESSPIVYGADTNVTGAGTVMGYPELNGRYKFYVAFSPDNCELFRIAGQVPGRQGNGGTIYGGGGTPYDYGWAANLKWCAADCVENVYNTAGMPVPLAGSGSWVRIDSVLGNTLNCTFRIECNNPDGSNAQDIMGTFSLALPRGAIALQKESSNADMTNSNALYNLAGAEYGVFDTEDAARAKDRSLARATFITDEHGAWESGNDFLMGTYYLAELNAPDGFALSGEVKAVTVNAGETTPVTVQDAPLSATARIRIEKQDAETGATPQGDGSLADAEITFNYYDGYYTPATLPGTPTRTWTMWTGDDGVASLSDGDARKAAGDEFFRDETGAVILPLGTIAAVETKAPAGYLLGEPETIVAHVSEDASGRSAALSTIASTCAGTSPDGAFVITNEIMHGGLSVGKISREIGAPLDQGAATLAGWTFEIVNRSAAAVIVDGVEFAPGAVVKTVATTPQEGSYIACANMLPYGTYEVREVQTMRPQDNGYLFDEQSAAWRRTVSIFEEGQIADLTGIDDACANQVVRGDLELSKVKSPDMTRLAGIPFRVTSKTTGEWHIAVTDRNGCFTSAASTNAHSTRTNANDSALDSQGLIDESLLDDEAGMWFSGRADAATAPDDAKGALPFDTYIVEELPVAANEGLNLVTVETTVYRDGATVELGTLENIEQPTPRIVTSLADERGNKVVSPDGTVKLIDTVVFNDLDESQAYELVGELHLVENGVATELVATSTVGFIPEAAHGTVEVPFEFDAERTQGRTLVCFEYLLDGQGAELVSHADAENTSQSVRVPETPAPNEPEEPDTPPASEEPPASDEPPSPPEPEPEPQPASKPTPTPAAPQQQATTPSPAPTPKTGDFLPFNILLVFIPAGAIGLALSALAVRKLEREKTITIERGIPRR